MAIPGPARIYRSPSISTVPTAGSSHIVPSDGRVPSGTRHAARKAASPLGMRLRDQALEPHHHSPAPAGPVTVQRRVSQSGSIMVATQKIQASTIHARRTGSLLERVGLAEVAGSYLPLGLSGWENTAHLQASPTYPDPVIGRPPLMTRLRPPITVSALGPRSTHIPNDISYWIRRRHHPTLPGVRSGQAGTRLEYRAVRPAPKAPSAGRRDDGG